MITTSQKIMLIIDKKTASALNRACGCARYAYNWARTTWLAKKKAGQESLFLELNNRFNTDVVRREFTPVEIVALATSLSGCGEPIEDDAHRLLTRDGRAAMVDGFFVRLWNQVANATRKCYI